MSVALGNIIKDKASDIGFFSGWVKNRLKLSEFDQSNKFAIAIIKSNAGDIICSEQELKQKWDASSNQKWVPLKTASGYVKADINSIAKRIKFQDRAPNQDIKGYVRNLCESGLLEGAINESIKNSTKNLKSIQENWSVLKLGAGNKAILGSLRLDDTKKVNRLRKSPVETSGKIYQTKPKIEHTFFNTYVPYSEDGKIWVMLNLKSLSNSVDLSEASLKVAANLDEDGKMLVATIEAALAKKP